MLTALKELSDNKQAREGRLGRRASFGGSRSNAMQGGMESSVKSATKRIKGVDAAQKHYDKVADPHFPVQ